MDKKIRAALYTRVSTSSQDTDVQEAELKQYAQNRGWEVSKIYSDKASGTKQSRPALDELMGQCRKRRVDIVLVWKFDRFARSLRHLVSALEEFKTLGINFISATEGIDTTIPSGELVFQIFGAIAQFERELIVQRVKAGLLQAKREGKVLGRPPKKRLSKKEVEEIRSERAKGVTLRELSRKYGSSLWSVYQASLGATCGVL